MPFLSGNNVFRLRLPSFQEHHQRLDLLLVSLAVRGDTLLRMVGGFRCARHHPTTVLPARMLALCGVGSVTCAQPVWAKVLPKTLESRL